MKEHVVAVSQHTVFLAEASISGCIACNATASVPLTYVLDRIVKYPSGRVDYILPVLAACPKCHAPLDEEAVVAPKPAYATKS